VLLWLLHKHSQKKKKKLTDNLALKNFQTKLTVLKKCGSEKNGEYFATLLSIPPSTWIILSDVKYSPTYM
jgi:hypothetical protein